MVDRFRRLNAWGQSAIILVTLAVVAGCYIGGRRLLSQASQFPAPDQDAAKGGPPHSVEITSAAWVPTWFADTTTFTGDVVARADHGAECT
ncbi:MAG: hypothetical protein AB1714_21985 [Acidobacteriota bacterium]